MLQSTQRVPWPHHAWIGGLPVMLVPVEGKWLYRAVKIKKLDGVTPTEYSYDALPPYREKTYEFMRLAWGMGERFQKGSKARRYYFAINADLSIGGMPRRGPKFNSVTPTTTSAWRGFEEFNHSGTLKLFGLTTRYLLRRDADTAAGWVNMQDMATNIGNQIARFKDSAGTDALYVGTTTGDFWRTTDGNAWTKFGTTASIPARCVANLREEFWRSWVNGVSKCTSDPTVSTNWSAYQYAGDASSEITWMGTNNNLLYMVKSNGSIYTFDADGAPVELYPGVEAPVSTTQGSGSHAWGDKLWVRLGDVLYSIDGGNNLTPIGPERMLENASEVRGPVQCVAGHGTYFLYECVYNSATSNGYLLKHGTYLPPGDGPSDSAYDFAPIHHGAIIKWASKQPSACFVASAPASNERLYVGFSDGDVGYAVLPKGTPDPYNDANCEFTTDTAYYRLPKHHMLFPADNKSFRGASVFGPVMDASNYIRIEYRLDSDTAAFTDMGQNFDTSGDRIDFAEGIAGKYLDLNIVLYGTPLIEGLALHEQLRPALMLEYELTVDCSPYQCRLDGSVEPRDPLYLRTALKNQADATSAVTVLLPDEQSLSMSFVDYVEVMPQDPERHGLEWDLLMKGVQFKTNTIYGTWRRVSAYTWRDVRGFSWRSIMGL